MLILDGKAVSKDRREKLKSRVQTLINKTGRPPQLTVIIVGDHLPSQVYVRNKVKACADVGITSHKIEVPADVSVQKFTELLHQVDHDPKVDGVLVQLPLPKQLQSLDLGELLNPEKDADGFTYGSLGKIASNKGKIAPCTPKGVMSILEHYKIPIEGKNAVVVGRSMIVGKPMTWLLADANATVTMCHSKTKDMRSFTKAADIVVVAAGKKHLLGKDDFKKGAIVIDVGMHGSGEGGGVTGDVRFNELEGWAEAATPVPGGVGPMTITTLLENTVTLAEIKAGLA